MRNKRGFILLLVMLFSAAYSVALAEAPDEGEGRQVYLDGLLKRDRVAVEKLPFEIMMKEKIEKEKPKPVLPKEKVFIKDINVIGTTVFTSKEISDIIEPFQNRELSGKEMQRCADQISDYYSIKGYISSYAYVNPELLDQGILEINAVEGKVGDVAIEGNRYFSTKIYKQRIGVKEGDIFNIKLLKNNVFRTNRHQDRKVNYDISPTESLEQTDVVVSVKDKLPLHATFSADNYGSEYILYKRYKNTFFIHNNITGHDDKLSLKAQFGEADAQRLFDADYYLPLNNDWTFQLYFMPYKRENYYYRDNEDKDFMKEAMKWYFYFYQTLFSEPNREFSMNYGFVYKELFWYVRGDRKKWDRFRALLWGFDYVRIDDYGTTVVSNDLEIGIPRLMGGATAEDDSCSVKGAGGKYKKDKIYIARRQKLPWELDFLFKFQGQLSSQALTGVNVFSIGGFMGTIENRGYPRAQLPMDSGFSIVTGFSFPPYFLPRDLKVPLSKSKWYDAIELFTFYEYAKGYKTSPKTAAEKIGDVVQAQSGQNDDDASKSLSSAGLGFIFSLPEHALSIRLDIGWPLNHKLPKDNDHAHVWFGVVKSF